MLAVAVVASLIATGQDVRHNYMPGTDFSKYHNYKWVPIEGGGTPEPDHGRGNQAGGGRANGSERL